MTMVTDSELLLRCSAGDADAFGVVVQRYQNFVCSVAYSVVGDFAHSEDIGQETFITAWKRLAELKDHAKFRSWIAAIARNLALSVVRRERRSVPMSDEVAEVTDDAEEAFISQEEQDLVWSTLRGLPDTYREPLVLFYRQNCSIADVATSLELSEAAVRQRLSRGRELLRSEVASVVERTLRNTIPGAAFTLAVIGGVSGMATASAAVAVIGTAGKSTAPIVIAAAKTGVAAGWLGAAFGVLGGALGPWLAWKNARYESERAMIVRMSKQMAVLAIIFFLPFAAMMFGWKPWALPMPWYAIGLMAWILGFQVAMFAVAFLHHRRWKTTVSHETEAATQPLPPSGMQRWMEQWEPRNYTSAARLFGLPLVQIASAGPSSGGRHNCPDRSAGTAKAWIAIGDRAFGVLFAMGSFACGGIAMGAISVGAIAFGGVGVGLVAFGGLAAGVLSIGGLTVGVFAWGGLACGLLAFGGMALAWKAAVGGMAVAREFAVGGGAYAAHANDDAARQFVQQSGFIRTSETMANWLGTVDFGFALFFVPSLIPVVVMWLLKYRRKDVAR